MFALLRRVIPVAVLALLAVGVAVAADPPKKVIAHVTIGKDTTLVDGPLDKDGFIDYETALNERMRGKTTPESNAVVLLLKAVGPKPEGSRLHADYYKWLGCKEQPEDGDHLLPYGKFFEAEIKSPDNQAFFDYEAELRRRPWTAKEEPKYAEWLKINEGPLLTVTAASKRPDYFYPFIARDRDGKRAVLIASLLSLVQRLRELASILSLRAMYHCGEKKYDAAWDDLMTIHRLARLISRGGSLIEVLVGIAIDTIARGGDLRFLEVAKPTGKQLAKYRDDLAALPPMAKVPDKVALSERFTFLDVAQTVRRDGFQPLSGLLDDALPDLPPEKIEAVMAKLDWDRILRAGNSWYERAEAALRKPTRAERLKAAADLEAELKKAKADDLTAMFKNYDEGKRAESSDLFGRTLGRMLLPATMKVNEASDRQEQNHRTLLVAFALAAYHAEFDEYPEALADLAPKHLKTIPGDLYSGKPLIYKRTKAGYEVYSVGVNGKDDNCQLMTDEPRGDDLGVRMPSKK